LLARGPGQADRVREDNVRFKATAVTVGAAALWLGMAGSALATPLSHESAAAPQVTGARLQSALLPVSAFGDGFTVRDRLNTGKSLWSTRASIKPSGLSCATFETYIFVGGFGDTAGATEDFQNPNPAYADYPSVVLDGDQTVIQFKTAQAAASFYNRAYARYNQCHAFTESDSSIQLELTNQSLSKTTIAGHTAFQLIQYVDLSAVPALNFYANTTVVLAGTNVYTIDDVNGTNDPISTSLLSDLIDRIQALYKHH
jgi:hypothetical protein